MIVDSSALVAILRAEPERADFVAAITRTPTRMVATPTLLETSMVLAGSHRADMLEELDTFLRKAAFQTIPFTAEHAAAARAAFLRYGKGRHPAALNFGDCIAYAAAKLERLPLLFKGDDFRRTDIRAAL